ncbi:hypothetical protein HELRODRAFT_189742 [Helobdella robusta]|uniref:K Homology domain-containing protein n=1 Tax=Helobdella robusta TaxID=6412 RepID=T1FRB9_HELRO|nr:hypothetical protein HELRODRAFT_189742 [Helobdella robusta]ESN91616.1 hypothetical protein HELRODRAFT_189742 [Helobdella robusta]
MSDSPRSADGEVSKRAPELYDDGDDSLRKKSRYDRANEKTEVRILIPSWISGSVIGKGGDNIRRLRSTYKSGISLPDSRGPERLVVMTSEIGNICDALEDILPTLTKQLDKSNTEDHHELRLLIHQSHAGRIIGKGGTIIKQLRDDTGAQVRIHVVVCPNSSDRIIQINGSAHQISSCVEAIYKLISGSFPKGPQMPYNPDYYDISLASKYGGYEEERGGGMGKGKMRDREEKGEKDSPHANTAASSQSRGSVRKNQSDDRHAKDQQPQQHQSQQHQQHQQQQPYNNKQQTSDDNQPPHFPRDVSQVSIPKSLAGAILGKGGSRIKQVQQESGTRIKMDEASVDSDDRIITIVGTPEQIMYAQYLLQMMVKKYANNGGKTA